jgi:hypothetical protein
MTGLYPPHFIGGITEVIPMREDGMPRKRQLSSVSLAIALSWLGILYLGPAEARDNRPTTGNICSCRCTSNETNPNGTPVASQVRHAVVSFACDELNGAICHIPRGDGVLYVGTYDRCGTVVSPGGASKPGAPHGGTANPPLNR